MKNIGGLYENIDNQDLNEVRFISAGDYDKESDNTCNVHHNASVPNNDATNKATTTSSNVRRTSNSNNNNRNTALSSTTTAITTTTNLLPNLNLSSQSQPTADNDHHTVSTVETMYRAIEYSNWKIPKLKLNANSAYSAQSTLELMI